MPVLRRYVYDIPPAVREDITRNLDVGVLGQGWLDLAVKLLPNQVDVELLRRATMYNSTPANDLFKKLDNMMTTIDEVYAKLKELKHVVLCKMLEPYVSPQLRGAVMNSEDTAVLLDDVVPPDTGEVYPPDTGICGVHREEEERSVHAPIGPQPQLFAFADLSRGTNHFSDSNLLGSGRYWKTYRAELHGTEYAVKLHVQQTSPEQEKKRMQCLQLELQAMHSLQHENVLRFFGLSGDSRDTCLVFQYMSNGSLQNRLQCKDGTAPLHMLTRLRIAVGVSRGLHFLHTTKPMPQVHGNLSCSNILLDSDFRPCICDWTQSLVAESLSNETGFGGQYTHATVVSKSHVLGLQNAYTAPELLNKGTYEPSLKSDVYSFGVIIWCICTGREAFDEKTRTSLVSYMDDVYYHNETSGNLAEELWKERDKLCSDWLRAIYLRLCDIARNCSDEKKKKRPEAMRVQRMLEEVMYEAETQLKSPGSTPLDTGALMNHLPGKTSVSQVLEDMPKHQRKSITPVQLQMMHDHFSMSRQCSSDVVEESSVPEEERNVNVQGNESPKPAGDKSVLPATSPDPSVDIRRGSLPDQSNSSDHRGITASSAITDESIPTLDVDFGELLELKEREFIPEQLEPDEPAAAASQLVESTEDSLYNIDLYDGPVHSRSSMLRRAESREDNTESADEDPTYLEPVYDESSTKQSASALSEFEQSVIAKLKSRHTKVPSAFGVQQNFPSVPSLPPAPARGSPEQTDFSYSSVRPNGPSIDSSDDNFPIDLAIRVCDIQANSENRDVAKYTNLKECDNLLQTSPFISKGVDV